MHTFAQVLNPPKIIRHGLWYKTIANGRAYGHGQEHRCCISFRSADANRAGVYFAKNAETSLGYSAASGSGWRNSSLDIQSCVALAEIVNMPSAFASTNPYWVVPNTDWIIWCASACHDTVGA